MKKILITAVLAILAINVFGQWNPTTNNPYKWYRIVFDHDTIINGLKYEIDDTMYVTPYQHNITYQYFEIDSIGNFLSYPIKTTLNFKCFNIFPVGRKEFELYIRSEFVAVFVQPPYEKDNDNTFGISQIVNQYLSEKYNVPLNKITE